MRHFAVNDLLADAERLTIGPDDYLVVTVHEPKHLSRQMAAELSDYIHRAFPQLGNRIIVKPPDIELQSKPREEVVADAGIPPWLRR
jgi:hypothetical protein